MVLTVVSLDTFAKSELSFWSLLAASHLNVLSSSICTTYFEIVLSAILKSIQSPAIDNVAPFLKHVSSL